MFSVDQQGKELDFLFTKRPPAIGRRGAVTSPHYLASQAGQDMLKRGGHAVDAAIAMDAVLTVVYPHMSGLGGDSMMMLFDQKDGKVRSLNGSSRAGEEASRKFYTDQGFTEEIPERGALAVNTVPGTVGAWWELHQQYGRLSWKEILEPAYQYAKNGFPMTEKLVSYLKLRKDLLSEYKETKRVLVDRYPNPSEGDWMTQPELADTYEQLMEDGVDAFYKGPIARKIVRSLRKHGGMLTENDFASYQPEWTEPLSERYRDVDVYQMRPNTQGMTILILLNILNQFDLQEIGDNTPDYYHLITEATKLAFLYKNQFIADERFMEKDPTELTEPALGKRLAKEISFEHASGKAEKKPNLPHFKSSRDTVFSAVVDAEGNSISFIQSIFYEFGSAFMAEDTGIILQNRGSFFSLDENHPNRLEPRKKTFHTLMPGMVLKDGKPILLVGSMGGEGQPQTQTALITRMIDFGYNVQQAIEAPRWLYGKTWGETSDSLKLERRISDSIVQELERRGQEVDVYGKYSETMGHSQAIKIDPVTGTLSAGADPRGDGLALSW